MFRRSRSGLSRSTPTSSASSHRVLLVTAFFSSSRSQVVITFFDGAARRRILRPAAASRIGDTAIRIYTRTGDGGETGLFGGQRVGKDDLRVEAYGTVDELNAALGVVRTGLHDPDLDALLQRLQGDLFTLGADLATPVEAGDTHGRVTVPRVPAHLAAGLETEIDRLEAELEPLTRFILPGGAAAAAHLHLARAVCRRAERRCVSLARAEDVNAEALRYLNRLSDLLFVMARVANRRAGSPDVAWEPGR